MNIMIIISQLIYIYIILKEVFFIANIRLTPAVYLIIIIVELFTFIYFRYKVYKGKKNFKVDRQNFFKKIVILIISFVTYLTYSSKYITLLSDDLTLNYFKLFIPVVLFFFNYELIINDINIENIKSKAEALQEISDSTTDKKIADFIKANKFKYNYNNCNDRLFAFIELKKNEAIKSDIKFNTTVNFPDNLYLIEKDLLIILGNLLSNAIEANENSNDKNKIFINLQIFYDRNLIAINCENYFDFDILKKDDVFYTTKKDKKNHGKGIKIIKKYVKKNNGTIQISAEDNIFKVNIVMLLKYMN